MQVKVYRDGELKQIPARELVRGDEFGLLLTHCPLSQATQIAGNQRMAKKLTV